jgi:hypothetical protein
MGGSRQDQQQGRAVEKLLQGTTRQALSDLGTWADTWSLVMWSAQDAQMTKLKFVVSELSSMISTAT